MTARVLVAGGNGRLGRAVLASLGDRGVPGVRRRGFQKNAIAIDSDGHADPAGLKGIAAVINCAGRVSGTRAAMWQANVTYPTVLARAARAAGIERFVQVSSFSVYGNAERIDAESEITPEGYYGSSKVAAEQALAALAADGFRPALVRFPFMFSVTEPALLGRLIAAIMKVRVLPTRAGRSTCRSMITYGGAADALIAQTLSHDIFAGASAGADPQPLDLTALVQTVRARLRKRIAIVPVPAVLVATVRLVAPQAVDRILRSNVLAASANLLAGGVSHPVAAELDAYLDRLVTR